MKLQTTLRPALLLGSAALALAACDTGGDVESSGVVAPVTVNVGGGNQTPQADGVINFAQGGCPTGAPAGTITVPGSTIDITACIIPTDAPLTSDLTLAAGSAYALAGTLYVGENPIGNASATTGVTLTIEPGVVVFGANGEDALVINPGSDINAVGTATSPIIFTSATDLADADAANGDRTAQQAASDGLVNGLAGARGQWGGIVINGLAPINDCEAANVGTVNCTKAGEGASGSFGGLTSDDDSGAMSYVRIQYPGFLFSSDDELNGLALQGVGSETELSYIHVHNSADDAFEWFGGTVSADHIVATGAGDDSFDWTDGWTGSVQFGVVVQTTTESGDPRGLEGDSNGDFPNRDPRSFPVFANLTLVSNGPATGDDGIKIRRGTDAVIANTIVSNFNGNSIDYDAGTGASASTATPVILSTYVAGSNADATDSEAQPIFDAAGANNVRGTSILPSVFSIEASRDVEAADLADDDENDADLPRDGITEVNYIGAFADSVQSFNDSWLFDWALEIAEFSGGTTPDGNCPEGTLVSVNTQVPAGRSEQNVCTLPNLIAGDISLTSGNLYELDGSVFVGQDAGADPANPIAGAQTGTLTIPAGVTLFGLNGPDALIVSRGSRIIVNGTDEAPVVMTSRQDVEGDTVQSGQWGGLVINGRAPINDCEEANVGTLDCEKSGEGGSGQFGGLTADDDSGTINYLRVQYAGFLFGADDELNGIAFQGVGSGTTVDYIQAHDTKDDGIEFFGGTVNLKHAIVTSAGDDAFDWTDGWQGKAQFVILVEDEGESGDPRGVEADSNGDFPDRDPRSNPTIANLTLLANDDEPSDQEAVEIRRGTGGAFYNWIIAGENDDDGIDFDNDSASVEPTWFSTYVVDFAAPLVDVSAAAFSAANGNVNGDAAGQDSTLTAAAGASEALVPGANENALTAQFPTGDSFFDAVDYIGAVEDADDTWYLGWTIGLSN
jgi:hypothetical protein